MENLVILCGFGQRKTNPIQTQTKPISTPDTTKKGARIDELFIATVN
jgi:hypothetical protein